MDVTTSVKVQHEYAIGALEDIKRGNMLGKDVKRTMDLEEAVSIYAANKGIKFSLILLPNLIGVYRRVEIGFHPSNATGESVKHDYASEPYEGFDVHPSLVQIGFDPEFFKISVICDYIGSESRRMIITPYQNLKPASENLLRFSDLTSRRFVEVSKKEEFSEEERREYLNLVRELLKSDGLTKPDYDSMMKSSSIVLL